MYSLAVSVRRFSGLLLLPIYTRYLTPTNYGVMELLDLTCAVATLLLGMRLADAMLYHYFNATAGKPRNAVLTTALLGSLGIGSVAAAAGWFAAPAISVMVFTSAQYANYLRLMFLSVGLTLPQSLGYAYVRAQNRSGLFFVISVCKLGFQVALILWLLVMRGMGVGAMVWGALIAYAVEALLSCWYILYSTGTLRVSFDWPMFKKLSSYGAPLAIGSIGMLILHFGDRYVLSRYVSLSQIGIYALGYKLGMLVAYVQEAFTQYWNAQMFSLLQGYNSEKLYVRISTYYTVSLLFVGLVLSLFSRPLLELVVTPPYYPAAAFVPVIALAYILRGTGDYWRTVLLVEKRTGLDTAVVLCGVAVCLVLYLTLIPRMGAWGAAFATLAAFGAMVPLSLWWAQRIRRHAFEWKRIGLAAGWAGILYAAGQFLIVHRLGPAMLLASLFCLAFPAVLLASGFLHEDEVVAGRAIWIEIRRRASTYLPRIG
jgi:O-antigen/teichoic acid export membrane protein